jgi:hypothetical protein
MGYYSHGPYWYGWKDLAIPRECGVYFLLRDGLIQYIGRSKNMWLRIHSHSYAKKIRSGEFTVECYPVPFDESVRLEREWIAMIDPPLNYDYVSKEARHIHVVRKRERREAQKARRKKAVTK